jgi:diguanylate cyclase (GGDEF)-like protein
VSAAASTSGGDKGTIRQLRSALSRALKLIQQLQASVETDFLLGILNRRGFERELTRAIAYVKRYHATAALIVLDVDRLKPINDAFGHGAGDEVLKAIVSILNAQVRASDVVARLGGDEFALLLWNLNETEARAKAAALEQAIDRLAFLFGKSTIMAGASTGVAMLGKPPSPSKLPTAQCTSARRSAGTRQTENHKMEEHEVVASEALPTLAEYIELRTRTGWGLDRRGNRRQDDASGGIHGFSALQQTARRACTGHGRRNSLFLSRRFDR